MLTETERTQFRLATAAFNTGGEVEDASIDDAYCTDIEVVETRDTVADFVANGGKPTAREGALFVWENVQTRKGARRGHLFVMDFGGVRAAFFDGERNER